MAEAAQTRSQSLLLGDQVPDFTAETQSGSVQFYDFIKDSWAILFSHPADYTPVCTTELGRAAKLQPEFEKRGVKVAALSCDSAEDHKGWIKDIDAYNACRLTFPIFADPTREIARRWGMIQTEGPTTAQGLPLTVRSLFIIGPDKKLKLSITYPASTGRNFDEVLRVVDSLQLTFNRKLATPVDWKQGENAIILPSVQKAEADQSFPGYQTAELPSGKQYLRTYKPE